MAHFDKPFTATHPDNRPTLIRPALAEAKGNLRLHVPDHPGRGGDRQPSTQPITNAVVSAQQKAALIQLPAKAGNYRLFVYAFDPKGSAATANLPLQIKAQP